jgi:hypothetical protein
MSSARLLLLRTAEKTIPEIPKCVTATPLLQYALFHDFRDFQHKAPLTSCSQDCRKAESRNAERYGLLFRDHSLLSEFHVLGLRDVRLPQYLAFVLPVSEIPEVPNPENAGLLLQNGINGS